MSEISISDAFRLRGVRRTPQRYAVLEFLMRHPVHATAEEILEAVNASDPRVSRATIYNTLRTLIRAGLVREVAVEGNAARFDAALAPHHHFVCERCGGVEDVPWFALPQLPPENGGGSRRIRSYEIVFRGICEGCGGIHEDVVEEKNESGG